MVIYLPLTAGMHVPQNPKPWYTDMVEKYSGKVVMKSDFSFKLFIFGLNIFMDNWKTVVGLYQLSYLKLITFTKWHCQEHL